MFSLLFARSPSSNISIAIGFCFLGIISHLSILSKEIDSSGGSLLVAFGLGWLGLATTWANTFNLGFQDGALKASIACSCFIAGLLTSTSIYRLMFHRLRNFPGPWGAKLSRFYAFSMVKASDFKYHLHVESLHRQYGDFVRTGFVSACPM